MIIAPKAKEVADRLGELIGSKPRRNRKTFLGDDENYVYVVSKVEKGVLQRQRAHVGPNLWILEIQNFEARMPFKLSFNRPFAGGFMIEKYQKRPISRERRG